VNSTRNLTIRSTWLFLIALLLTGITAGAAAEVTTADGRQASITENGVTTVHHYRQPLHTSPATNSTGPEQKRTIRHQQFGLWLYDVVIGLNSDYDNDGHYSNFSITLDFDTSLIAPLVYAVLYVSIDEGPWNEYAVSGNFTIDGTNASDAYTIHATLDSGYPTGYYNHYIELYDAYSHDFLVSYGPGDHHYFHHLPFESSVHDYSSGFSSRVSLQFSGTGSIGPFSLGILALVFGLRLNRSRRHQKTLQ
jgi:hypothetical protein